MPGPQNGRYAAEPLGGLTSLKEFDSGPDAIQRQRAARRWTCGDTVKRIDGTEVPLLTPWLGKAAEAPRNGRRRSEPRPSEAARAAAEDASGAARRRGGRPEAHQGRRAEGGEAAARARVLRIRPDRRLDDGRSPGSTRTWRLPGPVARGWVEQARNCRKRGRRPLTMLEHGRDDADLDAGMRRCDRPGSVRWWRCGRWPSCLAAMVVGGCDVNSVACRRVAVAAGGGDPGCLRCRGMPEAPVRAAVRRRRRLRPRPRRRRRPWRRRPAPVTSTPAAAAAPASADGAARRQGRRPEGDRRHRPGAGKAGATAWASTTSTRSPAGRTPSRLGRCEPEGLQGPGRPATAGWRRPRSS